MLIDEKKVIGADKISVNKEGQKIYNGLININDMTEDEVIQHGTAWAYHLRMDGFFEPVEIDAFWHMGRTHLGYNTITRQMPEHMKKPVPEETKTPEKMYVASLDQALRTA